MSAPHIEGYELGAALGAGGMGQVFDARDADGRRVAVKVLREGADEVAAARLVREAELVGQMRHRALVRVHDAGRTDDGRPYLVMEHVDGETLAEAVAARGPLNAEQAWATVREVANALAHAHSHGVLHRDLKAANVLLDGRGRPKLSDFGLARREGDPKLSQSGASVGTPLTMAPEQWWAARVDERTDVYGLGAILYEALTGAAPWEGEEPNELVHRVATGAPRAPGDRGVELPTNAEAFVMRCLARRPEERPADVAAFVRAGDEAFGHARRPVFDPWIALVLPLLVPLAMGYAESHDPRVWLHESGWSGYAVIGGWLLGLLLAWRWPATRAFAPLLPALNGALGFVSGMVMVERHIGEMAPEVRFAIFNLGAAEASACWFLGAAGTASLCGFVALRELPRARPDTRAILAALAALIAGAVSVDVPTFCVGLIAAALALRGALGRPDAALASLAAVLALGVDALVRLFSESARTYGAELTRTERALALTEHSQSRTALFFVVLIALGALAAATRWRGVLAWPRRRLALGVLGALAVGLALVLPYASMLERRAELGASLERHLAVWTELDPPAGEGTREGRLGPTLQLGRRHVSMDSERVMLTRALDDDAGGTASLVLAQAIGARLEAREGGPDLVLAADRSLSTRVVRRALRAAFDVGVREIDLVTIAGEPLLLPASAPPEARVVLPSDVRAMTLRLDPAPPSTPDGTLADAARRWAERGGGALPIGE